MTKEEKAKWVHQYPILHEDYAFTVCRIEPENNLDMIIQAYLASRQMMPYLIVGNWKASAYGENLRNKYGNEKKLMLLDPIYDQDELNALRSNCRIYLHGHSAGGTNPSLVEAMYLALPIIAYRVSYNLATTNHDARYFHSSESLVKILNEVTDEDLEEMSVKMKSYAEKNYLWKDISLKYVEAIKYQD